MRERETATKLLSPSFPFSRVAAYNFNDSQCDGCFGGGGGRSPLPVASEGLKYPTITSSSSGGQNANDYSMFGHIGSMHT